MDTFCEQGNGRTTRYPFYSCISAINLKQTEIKLNSKYYCMAFLFFPLLGRKTYAKLIRNLPVAHFADKKILCELPRTDVEKMAGNGLQV